MQTVELDTAISMAGVGKFQIALTFVAGGCIATLTADGMAAGFVLPIIGCEMELSTIEKGVFPGATILGMFMSTNFWGFSSDVCGRKKIIILSLISGWFFAVCACLAPQFWLIVLLRVCSGAAYSGMSSTFYAYLTEFLPPQNRASFLAMVFWFDGIVFCLIPVIGWLTFPIKWSLNLGFVDLQMWRIMLFANSLYAPVTLMGVLWFPESPKYLVSIGKVEEAINVLSKVFFVNTGKPQHEYPIKGITKTAEDNRAVDPEADTKLSILKIFRTMRNQITPIFSRDYVIITLLGSFIQFCVYSSAYGSFLWIPEIVNNIMNHGTLDSKNSTTICEAMKSSSDESAKSTCDQKVATMVYVASFVFGAMYLVGCSLVGALVKYVGRRNLFAVLQISSGIAGFCIYGATGSISVTISLTLYVLLPTVSQILSGAILVDQYPTHLRSTAVCMSLFFARIGAYVTSNTLGAFFEYDCTLAIFTLGAISFVSGLAVFFIPRTENVIVKSIE